MVSECEGLSGYETSASRDTETMRNACRRIGISYQHGCALAAQNRFPCRIIRAGKRIVVPRTDLDQLLGVESAVK